MSKVVETRIWRNVDAYGGNQATATIGSFAPRVPSPTRAATVLLMTTQRQLRTADQILATAASDTSVDALRMGEISAHVAAGDLGSARRILSRTNRPVVAKALGIPIGTTDVQVPTLLQLAQQVYRLEQRVAELEDRPVGKPSTLTKAVCVKTNKRLDPAKLHADIDKYVTNIAQAGFLSSQVQRGELEKVAAYLEPAKRAHENESTRWERAAWQK